MTSPHTIISDFNKVRSIYVTETEDVKMRRESWQKLVKEDGLKGFFGNSKSPPATGIVFDYNTKEV
jgi:hypothetical protein